MEMTLQLTFFGGSETLKCETKELLVRKGIFRFLTTSASNNLEVVMVIDSLAEKSGSIKISKGVLYIDFLKHPSESDFRLAKCEVEIEHNGTTTATITSVAGVHAKLTLRP